MKVQVRRQTPGQFVEDYKNDTTRLEMDMQTNTMFITPLLHQIVLQLKLDTMLLL